MNSELHSRILLVEDDHYSAVATKATIEHEFPNVQVDPVMSVGKAMEILMNSSVHELIISDFRIDGETADNFISMLKSQNLDIPVIILTAVDENAKEVLGESQNDIFKKELGNQNLLLKIDDFLTEIGIHNGVKVILDGLNENMEKNRESL